MNVPKAPGWNVVFGFGLFWNAVIAQSFFGSAVCLVLLVCYYGVKHIDRYVESLQGQS